MTTHFAFFDSADVPHPLVDRKGVYGVRLDQVKSWLDSAVHPPEAAYSSFAQLTLQERQSLDAVPVILGEADRALYRKEADTNAAEVFEYMGRRGWSVSTQHPGTTGLSKDATWAWRRSLPLQIAVANRLPCCVEALVKAGAKLDYSDDHDTARVCCWSESFGEGSGLSLVAKALYGHTTNGSSSEGALSMANALLEHGATASPRNRVAFANWFISLADFDSFHSNKLFYDKYASRLLDDPSAIAEIKAEDFTPDWLRGLLSDPRRAVVLPKTLSVLARRLGPEQRECLSVEAEKRGRHQVWHDAVLAAVPQQESVVEEASLPRL